MILFYNQSTKNITNEHGEIIPIEEAKHIWLGLNEVVGEELTDYNICFGALAGFDFDIAKMDDYYNE
jgi:hypothetical protein